MKKILSGISAFVIAFVLAAGMMPAAAFAEGEADPVADVTAQLEAIDTLQQMQDKRYTYKVKSTLYRYDAGENNEEKKIAHETARSGYETYVAMMFAQRLAAQKSYDALSDEQKAQISSELVAKLDNELPTVFKSGTYDVTPSDNEYIYESVGGLSYEVSNHMAVSSVNAHIAQIFILTDTSDGKTSWTPDGRYVYGESNYEVVYCCDVKTDLESSTNYKRVNLEDSSYYSEANAKKIRSILQDSYPYVTVDEMKAKLIADGLDEEFVDSLTRADMIAAVQMAVWSYANSADVAQSGVSYLASIDIPKNIGSYFKPLHDYTNECWDWFPGAGGRSYDARAEYRVNNLAYHLCSLPGVEAEDDQIIISDVEITRADLKAGSDDTYNVGMYVLLNGSGAEDDDLKVTVTSTSEDGTVTGKNSMRLSGNDAYEMNVDAKAGDTIKVTVEGTQTHAKGVYFYEPEGGRDVSQCLVGVAEGQTEVNTSESFVFNKDIEKGLRIYKTAADTKEPISDITFDIYKVDASEGAVSAVPTEEEIERIAKEANKVDSVTTDATGYAAISLEDGVYMVVEQYNADKVEAPVDPFYIILPMDGEDIVSVYPKNVPVEPDEEEPVIPITPDTVKGKFTILKHDAEDKNKVLSGAEFKLYRAATAADTDTETILCEGIEYAVVPVDIDNLITGEDGTATSPELPCGVYFLEEVKAPAGYYLLNEAVQVTVKSSLQSDVETVEIANQHGAVLPETGGIGTVIFRILGGLLILCAAVLLIVRRRADA